MDGHFPTGYMLIMFKLVMGKIYYIIFNYCFFSDVKQC